MRAPAAFASDPTTQPAYRAQNRPEQGRPSEDRAWGFTPWGRPGNSPGHDRPSAHYRHWPFRYCSSTRPPRTWRRSQSAGRPTWRYRTGNPERLPALSSLPPPHALIGDRLTDAGRPASRCVIGPRLEQRTLPPIWRVRHRRLRLREANRIRCSACADSCSQRSGDAIGMMIRWCCGPGWTSTTPVAVSNEDAGGGGQHRDPCGAVVSLRHYARRRVQLKLQS
jgi:hypothetical protein